MSAFRPKLGLQYWSEHSPGHAGCGSTPFDLRHRASAPEKACRRRRAGGRLQDRFPRGHVDRSPKGAAKKAAQAAKAAERDSG